MSTQTRSTHVKADIDDLERQLLARGYRQVSPWAKVGPWEYRRAQGGANTESFGGPAMYELQYWTGS